MIKKTITYESLFEPGQKVTTDFWFHISKADMIGMKMDETLEARIKRIVEAKDNAAIYNEFKKMIELSVGQRDGEQFIRTPEYAAAFMNSAAFDELIMEILTSSDQGSAFIAGVLPSDMKEGAIKELAQIQESKKEGVDPFADEPAWVRDRRVPTKQEFAAATQEQKILAFQLQSEAKS